MRTGRDRWAGPSGEGPFTYEPFSLKRLRALSDGDLYQRTRWIAGRQNALEAELILCLGQVVERKVWARKACSSPFDFCLRALGFSEAVTATRLAVAQAALKHPEVVDALREGRVHLTGLRLLAPHLTRDNCASLLDRAAGQTKRRIQEIVSGLKPKKDPKPSIRPEGPKGGTKGSQQGSSGGSSSDPGTGDPDDPDPGPANPGPAEPVAIDPSPSDPSPSDPGRGSDGGHQKRPPSIEPLSEERFRLHVSISRSLRDKLDQAADLLSHSVPRNDLETVIDRGVTLLIEQTLKDRFSVGRKARTPKKNGKHDGKNGTPNGATGASRDIPAAIEREVYLRDGGRCAFVDDEGHRCNETAFLQLHHLDGWVFTGKHPADRIELRCAAHNQSEADDMFGRAFMDDHRNGKRKGGRPS